MKNITGAIVLIAAFSVFSQSGSPYSTAFPAAENPISEGGRWINGKAVGLDWNNVQTTAGKAYGAAIVGGYNDCIAVLNTTFGASQYAQGTVYRAGGYSPSGNHEIELLLRFQITAHGARGYEVLWAHDGGIAIVRWNGPLGDYTALLEGPNIGAAVDGDVLRAEISNGVIKVYKNGSLKATGPSNTTWTDGQPGVGFWPTDRGGVTPANYGWKAYQAGTIGSGTSLDPSLSTAASVFCDEAQPNPSNPSTLIRYGLSQPGSVSLTLHNAGGKAVATLVKGYREAGDYSVTISANGFPSGVYFVNAKIGAFNKTVKVLLLK